MQANELRIGNLVDTINRGGEVHLPNSGAVKILQIGVFNSEYLNPDEVPECTEWVKIPNTDLTPIPLTEEWLERLGFKFKEGDDGPNTWAQRAGDIFVTLSKYHGKFYYQRQVEYVHQLQNLYFALTGTELVVKNAVETS